MRAHAAATKPFWHPPQIIVRLETYVEERRREDSLEGDGNSVSSPLTDNSNLTEEEKVAFGSGIGSAAYWCAGSPSSSATLRTFVHADLRALHAGAFNQPFGLL